jgi:hypothetical protein
MVVAGLETDDVAVLNSCASAAKKRLQKSQAIAETINQETIFATTTAEKILNQDTNHSFD